MTSIPLNWTGTNTETEWKSCGHSGFKGRPALKTSTSPRHRVRKICSVETHVPLNSRSIVCPQSTTRTLILYPALDNVAGRSVGQGHIKYTSRSNAKPTLRGSCSSCKSNSSISPNAFAQDRSRDIFQIEYTRNWVKTPPTFNFDQYNSTFNPKISEDVAMATTDSHTSSTASKGKKLADLHTIRVPKTGVIRLTCRSSEQERPLGSSVRHTALYQNIQQRHHEESSVPTVSRRTRPRRRFLIRDKTVLEMIKRGETLLVSQVRDAGERQLTDDSLPPSIEGLLEFEIPDVPTLNSNIQTFVEANNKKWSTDRTIGQNTWSGHSKNNESQLPAKLLFASRSSSEGSESVCPTSRSLSAAVASPDVSPADLEIQKKSLGKIDKLGEARQELAFKLQNTNKQWSFNETLYDASITDVLSPPSSIKNEQRLDGFKLPVLANQQFKLSIARSSAIVSRFSHLPV